MYDATLPAHNGTNIQAFNHRDVITENREILGYDIQLASFGGKAASGTHSFPFSVMLPPGLPPSMKVLDGVPEDDTALVDAPCA